MNPMNRSLLFAALAAKTDFIDRSTLKKSLDDWSLEEGETCEEKLVRSGAVSEAARKALSALVDEHIDANGGDVDQSLSLALSETGLVSEFESVANATLRTYISEVVLPGTTRVARNPQAMAAETASRALGSSDIDQEFGRYRVRKALAKGGIGEVFRATDLEIGRDVALKRIQQRHASESFFRERFVLEAEVTGLLEHPNIVPVYGMGVDSSGQPFYAMRLIEGKSLAEHIDLLYGRRSSNPNRDETANDPDRSAPSTQMVHGAGKANVRKAKDDESSGSDSSGKPTEARLDSMSENQSKAIYDGQLHRLLHRFVQVCQAVDYAHSRGILHRDLKPDNIMLGPYGETLLLDWGLAKVLDDRKHAKVNVDESKAKLSPSSLDYADDTLDGTLIGTPAYMSPEQSLGWHDSLTPASDIYSLGATLYTILTGKRSVDTTELRDSLAQLQNGEIDPPREVNRRIAPALNAICVKAMAPVPSQRYQSAADLSEDLQAYLADESVAAYAEPFWSRAGRWTRKHRSATTGIVVGVGIVFISLIIGLMMSAQARRTEIALKEEAIEERNRATEYFELAFGAVDSYLNQITDDPELASSDRQALRVRLLESALAFLEELAAQEDDPLIQVARAKALHRVGRIKEELGEFEEAHEYFNDSVKLWRSFPDDVASTEDARLGTAQAIMSLALSHDREHRNEERDALADEALQMVRDLVAGMPDSFAALRMLGTTLNNVATMTRGGDSVKESEALYLEAIEVRIRLLESPESEDSDTGALLSSYANLHVHYVNRGDADSAEEMLEGAEAVAETIELDRALRDPAIAMQLANLWMIRGDMHFDNKRNEEARVIYEKAMVILQKLYDANPNSLDHQMALARMEGNLGIIEFMAENYELAESLMDSSVQRRRDRAESVPTDHLNQQALASLLFNRASLALAQVELDEASGILKEVIDTYAVLVEQFPNEPTYYGGLAGSESLFGDLLIDMEEYDEAEVYLLRAVESHKQLIEIEPFDVSHRETLARTYHQLSLLAMYLDDFVRCEEFSREAIDVREAMVEEERASMNVFMNLQGSRVLLAYALANQRKFQDAREYLTIAIDEFEALYSDREIDIEGRRMLGLSYYRMAMLQGELNEWADAVDSHRRSLSVYEGQVGYDGHIDFALALSKSGHPSDALEIIEAQIEILRAAAGREFETVSVLSDTYIAFAANESLDDDERQDKRDRCAELACEFLAVLAVQYEMTEGVAYEFIKGNEQLSVFLDHPRIVELLESLPK